jgi:hypothetical protein
MILKMRYPLSNGAVSYSRQALGIEAQGEAPHRAHVLHTLQIGPRPRGLSSVTLGLLFAGGEIRSRGLLPRSDADRRFVSQAEVFRYYEAVEPRALSLPDELTATQFDLGSAALLADRGDLQAERLNHMCQCFTQQPASIVSALMSASQLPCASPAVVVVSTGDIY